jgi:hypothetical protein
MLGGHFDFVRHLVFFFFFFAEIYYFIFFNDLNYQNISLDQLKRDRKNAQKVMKYNKKKIFICEGPNPSSILELIDNESKNPNVSLILIQSSIRIQNWTFVGLKMAKIQGSDGRIDKYKIAFLNIASILNCNILDLRNMEVPNFVSPKWVYVFKSVEKWLCKTQKYETVVGAILKF